MQPYYDPEAVRPMWEELVNVGIRPLTTPQEVEQELTQKKGTTLVVINSVCGCAAGGARPGVMQALQHRTIPDHLVTVFAGMDREAVDRVREYMRDIPPSSPCIALFKDGELVHVMPRQTIEMMDSRMVAQALTDVFDQHCTAPGPSIPPEEYAKINPVEQCGSKIPVYSGV
ncbi:MAG: BrxA/BrxB family bacilliredoxin [Candidatus Omnitrophota bacterium]|jgi:putative YphP/YqiW family bacilliredoxin|nr:MAG: BrxA/BrxB family bacilliredoxin [Candidatus Omnitrophota bacterium]